MWCSGVGRVETKSRGLSVMSTWCRLGVFVSLKTRATALVRFLRFISLLREAGLVLRLSDGELFNLSFRRRDDP